LPSVQLRKKQRHFDTGNYYKAPPSIISGFMGSHNASAKFNDRETLKRTSLY
jgi:hypothetical protein